MVEIWFEWITINYLQYNAANHQTTSLEEVAILINRWQFVHGEAIVFFVLVQSVTKKDSMMNLGDADTTPMRNSQDFEI